MCRSSSATRCSGSLALESLEQHTYDDATERLLATVASSMGVALNNARLFDETKRLLGDADERAAELAIINEVQQGLAAQLDMQAMYDLVGDRLREIFDAQVLDIGVLDKADGLIHFPYTIERGCGSRRADLALRVPQARDGDPRADARERADRRGDGGRGRGRRSMQGEAPKSTLWVR